MPNNKRTYRNVFLILILLTAIGCGKSDKERHAERANENRSLLSSEEGEATASVTTLGKNLRYGLEIRRLRKDRLSEP